MKYEYVLKMQKSIINGKPVNFSSTELITKRDKKILDEFFNKSDRSVNLTFSLGYLWSNNEFIIDIDEEDIKIEKMDPSFVEGFLNLYPKGWSGSFSLIERLKNKERRYMTINKGDKVVFTEETNGHSTMSVYTVFARMGNLIYIDGDENPYHMSLFKKVGEDSNG